MHTCMYAYTQAYADAYTLAYTARSPYSSSKSLVTGIGEFAFFRDKELSILNESKEFEKISAEVRRDFTYEDHFKYAK